MPAASLLIAPPPGASFAGMAQSHAALAAAPGGRASTGNRFQLIVLPSGRTRLVLCSSWKGGGRGPAPPWCPGPISTVSRGTAATQKEVACADARQRAPSTWSSTADATPWRRCRSSRCCAARCGLTRRREDFARALGQLRQSAPRQALNPCSVGMNRNPAASNTRSVSSLDSNRATQASLGMPQAHSSGCFKEHPRPPRHKVRADSARQLAVVICSCVPCSARRW